MFSKMTLELGSI